MSPSDFLKKAGLAQMLKQGVIMDVTSVEEALIAEEAGAVAVMALERVPSDIRKEGGVARMSDPHMIRSIMDNVSIPVMAKVRIGHTVEAEMLEALGVDFIDESEVLTVADRKYHVNKDDFKVPFVCGAKDLGEALRCIVEGAAMIRTKGEAGTGDVSEAIHHIRKIRSEIDDVMANCSVLLDNPNDKPGLEQLKRFSDKFRVSEDIVLELVKNAGKLPVVNFAAGGIATPADAALCMRLGCDGVFVGSGIFKSSNPAKLAKAIVEAVHWYLEPEQILKASFDLGEPMRGIQVSGLKEEEKLSVRGW
ncbi:uncharacterized protein OGAPODRAFT_16198 [Ogataea polymorpha]|uniref:uncharacterized protein n=1 Tax=Ogataea polymorpha TaxID=460523 RepID=UPI0007F5478F|nr:uncharacterized protein OGAPODRAFT_16198 [Ogataea polymorpha]OBA16591.1 hypothetical protein OGAPODRAFT_16198 [Ogataea polymorpha]